LREIENLSDLNPVIAPIKPKGPVVEKIKLAPLVKLTLANIVSK